MVYIRHLSKALFSSGAVLIRPTFVYFVGAVALSFAMIHNTTKLSYVYLHSPSFKNAFFSSYTIILTVVYFLDVFIGMENMTDEQTESRNVK